nr:15029_t:CDS:2 [Entrophospora candida]
MNFTNTLVDVARNHTASYVRLTLNIQLNSRSIIAPTPPNLPIHAQRQVNQRTVAQQPQQQSTNNNNVSIHQQTQPLTISQPSIKQLRLNASTSLVTPSSSVARVNKKLVVSCNDVIRKLDALTNKKHKLEKEQEKQENKSFDSHENLNKKGRSDNNSIDLEYDNPPKDYDKEPSFEELFKSIRKLVNTMEDISEASKETEESHIPCRMYVENSSDLDCISSALSKSA